MSSQMKRYEPAVGPRLARVLAVVFALFALLVVNSIYLASVTVAGTRYQGWFYLVMFLAHLVLGLLIVVPTITFGLVHLRTSWNRPNRRAVRVGLALFTTALVLLATGFVLMRVDAFGHRLEINAPVARSIAYWLHVLTPVVAAWLFVLHRLAGRRIRWRIGLAWAVVAAVFAGGLLLLHSHDPRAWNVEGPKTGERYFFPSLARTTTGNFIPERTLTNDAYCRDCHADIHDQWSHSVHRFSSFNNPPYLFSVKGTRKAMMERDGDVQGSRFCAGCHDPVPFLSGAFDDPKFDDPEYDLAADPSAQAGITCSVCHAITHVNSVRGNGDYTIDEPTHYPFAFAENGFLRWVNRQLVKAKPEFHKATFLKPEIHRSTEFCGTCHKVHLPPELNAYKWLRGQDHQSAFLLSGVSGHGITSFYYPPKAEENCNGCHMPLREVSDRPNFSARARDDSGLPKTLDHQFPSANTAIPHLMRGVLADADGAIAAHREFLEGVMRVDLFGLRAGGRIDGELVAPLRPDVPELVPGSRYLLETVVRTVKMGHVFTQGTADSNEVWLDVTVRSGDRVIGRSGGRSEADNDIDPGSHFVNAFVLDREGRRIDRRNAQDIFVPLYSNQIPPGAADVVHYLLEIPPDVAEPVTVDVKLQYRKFDTTYMRLVVDDPAYFNDLPITTLATDTVTFPMAAGSVALENPASPIEPWQRWNDYGIGLLLAGQLGELGQAKRAFEEVERLGRPDGPVNLARVYLKEGLVQDLAPAALERAGRFDPPALEWTLLWLGAEVARRNGDHAKSVANLREILRGGFEQAAGRGFDFSGDWRVHDALGRDLTQMAAQARGPERERLLGEAREAYERALALDPEDVEAHWGLKQVLGSMGDAEGEARHAALHAKYAPDDNARDQAVAAARARYPAANRAAEAVVIYDLRRPGAYGLDPLQETAGQ